MKVSKNLVVDFFPMDGTGVVSFAKASLLPIVAFVDFDPLLLQAREKCPMISQVFHLFPG